MDSILVVENDALWQSILRRTLRTRGFQCIVVSDYQSAVDLWDATDVSVLVLDLELDVSNPREQDWEGWKLAQRARDTGVSSIIVTGHARTSLSSRAFREFAVIDFFDKIEWVEQKVAFLEQVARAANITELRRVTTGPSDRVLQEIRIESAADQLIASIDTDLMGNAQAPFFPPFRLSVLESILHLLSDGRTRWECLTEPELAALEDAGLSQSDTKRDLLAQIGMKLYDALATDRVGVSLDMVLNDARRTGAQATLQIRFDEHTVQIARYPWELIHNGRRFLAQGSVALTRYVAYPEAPPTLRSSSPMRVLSVVPRPLNIPFLPDVEEEQIYEAIEATAASRYLVVSRLPSPVTYDELVRNLSDARRRRRPFDIVFFDGHGAFGWKCKACGAINKAEHDKCQTEDCGARQTSQQPLMGYLFFEDTFGLKQSVSPEQFAVAFANSRAQIVCLSACDTAMVHDSTIFNSIGPRLIEDGVPVVISMQFPVRVSDTKAFFNEFFRAIGTGRQLDRSAVEEAVADARKMITSDRWFCPVLYLRVQ